MRNKDKQEAFKSFYFGLGNILLHFFFVKFKSNPHFRRSHPFLPAAKDLTFSSVSERNWIFVLKPARNRNSIYVTYLRPIQRAFYQQYSQRL